MIVVEINGANFGSTGTIARGIQKVGMIENPNTIILIAYPFSRSNSKQTKKSDIYIGGIIGHNLHRFLARMTGKNGEFSHFATYMFIRKLEKIKPDVIHLHNLHNFFINLPMFFSYIKRKKISVIWTLHDCWAFTGQCPHFEIARCNKWIDGCHDCSNFKLYPESYIDRTERMWKLKKRLFLGVENMTIVCPSNWLANNVKKSFLGNYNIKVINNGIDLTIFKPTYGQFIKDIKMKDKNMILGVAFDWGKRKGLDVFIELEKLLDRNKYKIVLVGVDKGLVGSIPKGILAISRTASPQILAQIYTAADVFVNPTREEVFGMVNIEALACGTPVITFNTGGSPETIDKDCGYIVEKEDILGLKNKIEEICEQKLFAKTACMERAKKFNRNDKFEEYIKLYNEVCNCGKLKK